MVHLINKKQTADVVVVQLADNTSVNIFKNGLHITEEGNGKSNIAALIKDGYEVVKAVKDKK